MELIRKSDALHAVLHNTGDAAVAAVQNIKPMMKVKVKDGCMEGTKLSQIFIDEWAFAEMRKENDDAADKRIADLETALAACRARNERSERC